jgi:hypothetical protein
MVCSAQQVSEIFTDLSLTGAALIQGFETGAALIQGFEI